MIDLDVMPDAEEGLLESEETEHSVLGASSAHRWMKCPGSIGLTMKLRSGGTQLREAGEAAALGTAAHTLGAACINSDREPFEFIGQRIDNFTVDQNMATAVSLYVNYCYEQMKGASEGYTELPLQSSTDPDAFGTADRVLFKPEEFIHIIDYKHGAGIVVEPDCAQTKYYGYLAYERRPEWMKGNREPKFIHMTIVQPRIPHPRGPIRTFTMTPQALTSWWEGEVLPAMKETRKKEALLHVGTWCRFCPARQHCPVFKQEVLTFSTTGVEPSYLTNDELGDILLKVKAIISYGEGAQKVAFERALNGAKIKNFKVVNKIANRVWRKEAAAELEKCFGQEAWEPRKLRSPAQIEKLEGGKKLATAYAFKPNTGLTLAPESDKREEVSVVRDYFAGLDFEKLVQ